MWWTNKLYVFPYRTLFLGKLKLSLPKVGSQKLCSKAKHQFKSYIYLFLLFFSSIIFGQGKDIRFEHITTNDGLPQGYVTSIIQDGFGFLWFGTQNGLVKYDGYNFNEYMYKKDDTNSISDNWITKIAVDNENNIWVGTGGKGLSKITPTEKIIRYPFNVNDGTGINASFVSDILIDKEGIIWFATTGGGLSRYSKKENKFKYYIKNGNNIYSPSDNNTAVLFEDSKGFIWIGTRDCGLDRFDKKNETFKNFRNIENENSSLIFNRVSSITEDRKGNLWIGTYGKGLDKFDPINEKFSHYNPGNSKYYGLIDSLISRVYIDSDGTLWVGTDDKGIYIYDPKQNYFHNYTPNFEDPTSIGDNRIWSIYEDILGIIWFGGFTGGLSKYDKNKNWFRHYKSIPNNPNSLKDKFVKAIIVDKNNQLWIGHNKGITIINRQTKEYSHLLENSKKSNNTLVRALCEDVDGSIWIGTWGDGLINYAPSSGKIKDYLLDPNDTTSLTSNHVRYIYLDSKKQLWICTTIGLNKFDRRNDCFERFINNPSDSNSLSNNLLYKIIEDSFGNYWIGTADGLVRYSHVSKRFKTFLHSTEESGSISDDRIRSIYQDSKGSLWVGTFGGGLNKFNYQDNTFTPYTTENGLANNVVYEIIEDDSSNLWLSTNNGLSMFNTKSKTFRNYSIQDGLQDNEFNGGASYKSLDGEMFFGGVNGINSFQVEEVTKNNSTIPSLVITEFRILNEKVTPISHPELLNENINTISGIELNYDQNFISFEFAALNFSLPSKNQYKYILKGLEKNWNFTTSNNRFANYTNLNPGDYTFIVSAANDNGEWNEEGISLPIIILPPWWLTWWANTIYLITVVFLVVLGGYLQKKKIKVKNEFRLKELENEKLKEIFQMKSKFYDNISHEFRTPLTLIMGPIERLRRTETNTETQRLYKFILRNSEKLLKLINQLLYLSKLESGTMKLNAQKSDIVSFTKAIVLSFRLLSVKKNIKLEINHRKEIIPIYFDKEKMTQIISNIMSNAIKYTPANGMIKVYIEDKPDQGTIFIKFSDTGIGISDSDIPKIFDRFYQATNSSSKKVLGTGIGLSLTKDLVRLHHGEIKVESELGKGSTFTLSLPIGRKHLEDNEVIIDDSDAEEIFTSILEETIKQKGKKKELPLLLIVDDDEEIRKYIINIVESNYRVIEAGDGKEAFLKALRYVPDLIISDIVMPVVSGVRLCEKIKQNLATCHIPFILLTAKVSEEEKIIGLEHGADDYLTKPFYDLELLVRIKNLIDQRHKLRERYLKEAEIHPTEVAVTSLDKKFINNIINIVDNNISNPNLSIEDLVDQLAISRAQLYRKFSSVLGERPNDFIRKYRIKRAAQLIEQDFGNITQVAYEVGFNDLSYFSKSFKNVFNVKPHDYKKQHANLNNHSTPQKKRTPPFHNTIS